MRTKCIVSADNPNGKIVPLSPEEEAQRDRDEAEAIAESAKPKAKTIEERLAALEGKSARP